MSEGENPYSKITWKCLEICEKVRSTMTTHFTPIFGFIRIDDCCGDDSNATLRGFAWVLSNPLFIFQRGPSSAVLDLHYPRFRVACSLGKQRDGPSASKCIERALEEYLTVFALSVYGNVAGT